MKAVHLLRICKVVAALYLCIYGLATTGLGADVSASDASQATPPIQLTATEIVIGPANEMLAGRPSGSFPISATNGFHAISFKGLGDVVGAVVIDGKIFEVPPGFIRESMAVSPDGKRLAYIVKKDGNKRVVVVDGKEGELYDAILTQMPVFSPDSKQVAYVAQIGSVDSRQSPSEQFLVLNGKEGKHYASIWPFVMFSPNGQHVLYFASSNGRFDRPSDQYFLVMDGVEGKGYAYRGGSLPQQNLTFSPDGKRFAFTVWDGKQVMPVIDGVEGKPYDNILQNSLVFSPDSKRVAFMATRAHKNLAVVDGVEGKEFDTPDRSDNQPRIFFSPDSKHVSYRAQHGPKYAMVVDGAEGRLYDNTDLGAAFSADGKHIAYAAKNGDKQFIVEDDVEGKPYAGAWNPVFSPDGKHLAYWARPSPDFAEQFVVVDGVEGKKYGRPAAGPLFSPDGKHVAFAAAKSPSQPFDVIVVDGVEFQPPSALAFDPRFAMFLPKTFYFENPTTLDFLAIKMPGQQFVRVMVNIKQASK